MFECNLLWGLQSVQLMKERSDVLEDEEKISQAAAIINDYSRDKSCDETLASVYTVVHKKVAVNM